MLKMCFFYYANANAKQVPGMLPFASRYIEGRISCFVTCLRSFYVILRTKTLKKKFLRKKCFTNLKIFMERVHEIH